MRSKTSLAQNPTWRNLAITLTALATLLAFGIPIARAATGGIVIGNSSGITTAETGSSVTFEVTLDVQPNLGEIVTVDVGSSDTSEGTVDPAILTFDDTDYNVPQSVTVSGENDLIDDGDVAYTITVSMGGATLGSTYASNTLALTNTDDDTAGFTVTETDASTITDESGSTDTFEVALGTEPVSDVVLTVASGDEGEGTVDPGQLTFTNANWDVPQAITVTGVDDALVDGTQTYDITISVLDASSDDAFDPLPDQTVQVDNTDDDTAGFTVTESDASTITNETGTTDTFEVVLDKGPLTDVVLTVTSSDEGEGTVDPAQLTFTNANWDIPQTVTVTGVNDGSDDGAQNFDITISVLDASSDDAFDPLPDQTLTASNRDDDPAPPTFDDTDGLSAETVTAIERLVLREITTGTSDSLFSPHQLTQRWQMALFLTRTLATTGHTLPAADPVFSDLDGYSPESQTAMNQLAVLQISTGTSPGVFSPEGTVTRWQMALFLVRTLEATGATLPSAASTFTDMTGYSEEVQAAVGVLTALGITTGTSITTFEPEIDLPRWQMALFIARTLDVIQAS